MLAAAKELSSCLRIRKKSQGTNERGEDRYRRTGGQGRNPGPKDGGAILKGKAISFQDSSIKNIHCFQMMGSHSKQSRIPATHTRKSYVRARHGESKKRKKDS